MFRDNGKMPTPKYSRNTLIGDWYNEKANEEVKTFIILAKRKNKELQIQKTRELIANMITKVPMGRKSKHYTYGSVVNLYAPHVNKSPGNVSDEKGLMLSISDPYNHPWYSGHFENDCLATASPSTPLIIRNSFLIANSDGSLNNEDTPLHYGDEFSLKTLEPPNVNYYLQPTDPFLGTPVGRCHHSIVFLTDTPSNYIRWVAKPCDPLKKGKGIPIKTDDEFYLIHASSNRFMTVENYYMLTLFGMEAEVSVHAQPGKFDKERSTWKFTDGGGYDS